MLLVPVELMPRQPDQPARMAQLRNTGGYILIFLCTLATYAPALNGGPLWDDDTHLTRPAMRSIHGLWRIWFDPGATQQSYPLLQTTFWIEHRMWGDAALGYHLANVALHSNFGLAAGSDPAAAGLARSVACRVHLCAPSGLRGGCGLDFGTKEHAFRGFLLWLRTNVSGF
jgi:hypothetical protein